MTREEIEQEIAEAQRLRELALMNVYRCDGAIAALEMLLLKMDEKDSSIMERIKNAGESPKE